MSAQPTKRPSMKKYSRDKKEKAADVPGQVMIGAAGPPSDYIGKVLDAFGGGAKTVTLKARGAAMRKATQVAEVGRRRVKGLYMTKEFSTEKVTDTYSPKKADSGLEKVTVESNVKGVTIVLSTDDLGEKAVKPMDEGKVLAPLSTEQLGELKEKRKAAARGRGRGKKGAKGGRGRGKGKAKDEFAWLPVRRGGKSAGGRGLPSRGGKGGLPSRGGGRGGGKGGRLPSRGGGRQAPLRSRGGGGRISGVPRSRGAGSRPYSAGPRRAAPVRSRGGGGGGFAPRSRGGGGYAGPPRSRGAGYGGPPRSRGGARRY